MTENSAMMTVLLSVHAVELTAQRAELEGRQTLTLAENANKVRGITKTATYTDLFYREVGEGQQLLGMVDAHMDQAGREAAANVSAEQTG